MSMAKTLRTLLARKEPLVVPLVYDALSARIAEKAGFECIGVSGSSVAASVLGVPDLGLVSYAESAERCRQIVQAVNIPVIADLDTGYGSIFTLQRAIREYEAMGVAGIFTEDQTDPKRCGHYAGTRVVPMETMAAKIRLMVETRRDDAFVIIARTDARQSLGLEEAVRRVNAYGEAGADILFIEGPRSEEEVEQIPGLINRPALLNNVEGGATPLLPLRRIAELGYKIVFYPDTAIAAAGAAMLKALTVLRRTGETNAVASELIPFEEMKQLLGYEQFEQLQQRFDTQNALQVTES